jgi:hypothetical protein
MHPTIPDAVIARPPGTLVAIGGEKALTLYIREDPFKLRLYPRDCHAELRVGTWEIDAVILVALVMRLGRCDATTFDAQIDAGSPPGVRLIQCLAAQAGNDAYLVTDVLQRTFRLRNPAREAAGQLLNRLHDHEAWPPEQWQAALARLNQLYPTATALWQACADQ